MRRYGLGKCIEVGLVIALVLGTVAGGVVAAGGGTELEEAGLGLPQILAMYLAGGLCGGSMFWVLQPYTNHKIGGAVVGFLVLLPATLTGALLMSADELPALARYMGAVATAAVVGGGIGYSESGN